MRAEPAIALLIAARALQGIGGGIAVLALALIIDATPPELRGKALGAWGAITGSPSRLARSSAVPSSRVSSGSGSSGSTVPVGIGVAVLTTRKVREGRRVFACVDLVGLALATFGVFGIAQALIRGNEAGWVCPILGGLIGGVIALVLFVAWERRSSIR